ncbi:MAG TPA: hypothetical protein ENJ68_00420 [Devosia sp.]|nr:hypothetical protein [Devosia sp.]
MTRAVIPLLRYELILQSRNKIYLAYGFVLGIETLFFVLLGKFVPTWSAALFFYSDPAVLGFFFLGALMMLERSENTRPVLATTPISAWDYFWCKTLSLTALSLVALSVLALAIHASINWPLLLVSVTLISLTFIATGFFFALTFKTVTAYLMGSAAAFIPIMLPMFWALSPNMPPYLAVLPPVAHFRLILIAVAGYRATPGELALLLVVTLGTAMAVSLFAHRILKKELGGK